uniref:Uncharacterized protein n=1 Tax=Ciona intestinalis TaxID=7719 RepID=H2XUK2_CIOIN
MLNPGSHSCSNPPHFLQTAASQDDVVVSSKSTSRRCLFSWITNSI